MEKLLEKYNNRPDIQNQILGSSSYLFTPLSFLLIGYQAKWQTFKNIFSSNFNNESK